jgi:predicted transcriptional regulator
VSVAMTLRLTDDEAAALRVVAEREHRSMQDVAREAIRQYVTARARRRDEAIAQVLREDGPLLDRLAEGPPGR